MNLQTASAVIGSDQRLSGFFTFRTTYERHHSVIGPGESNRADYYRKVEFETLGVETPRTVTPRLRVPSLPDSPTD